MIYLENDRLIIRFPEIHPNAGVSIDLQRTLRLPDDGKFYDLPPGKGSFPLRHIEDYDLGEQNALKDRGGLIMPMFQADALWINFETCNQDTAIGDYPVAIKIATGKACALTGKNWSEGLSDEPQNYLVVPEQPWLDGYNVGKDLVRQFVAAPLGEGVTTEEQLNSTADVGGIQIQAFPMKRDYFDKLRSPKIDYAEGINACFSKVLPMDDFMGLAPGGFMHQEVYDDPYELDAWDQSQSEKCFITIANANQWMDITNEAPPLSPASAEQYTAAGLPWFSYYDEDKRAIDGAKKLGRLKSFQKAYAEKGQTQWSEETLKNNPNVVPLGSRSISSGNW